MLGTNDVKRRYGPPSTNDITKSVNRILEIISRYQKNGRPAFLLPPPIGEGLTDEFDGADKRISEFCSVIRNIGEIQRIPVVDTHSKLKAGKHLNTDGVHLNSNGRQTVAEIVNCFLLQWLYRNGN